MTHKEFNELIEKRVETICHTLASKSEEYATKNDRFHNFNVAAIMNDTTPERALMGMMVKHLVSVFDLANGIGEITEEKIEEKIGDSINYLILLEGLLKDKLAKGAL